MSRVMCGFCNMWFVYIFHCVVSFLSFFISCCPCLDLWHQCWEAVEDHSAAILVLENKSHASERSLWSREPAKCGCYRLAAKGAEAHRHFQWTIIEQVAGVRSLARTVQRRVATVTLHKAEQYSNKSMLVSHVAVPRKRVPLEECIGLSAHEIVAGRRVGSVKCTKCLQVCGKKHLHVWLPATCIPWQVYDALFIPLPLGLPAADPPLNNFDQEDAEPQNEEDESQNDVRHAAFGDEVEKSALRPRLGAMSVHMEHRIFHHTGVAVCVKCGCHRTSVNRKLRRDCLGNPQENSEPRDSTARPRVASLCERCAACQDLCGEGLSATLATLCSRMALWALGRGGVGRRMCPLLSWSDFAPESGVLAFVVSSSSVLQFLAEMQCLFVVAWTGLRTQSPAVYVGSRYRVNNFQK